MRVWRCRGISREVAAAAAHDRTSFTLPYTPNPQAHKGLPHTHLPASPKKLPYTPNPQGARRPPTPPHATTSSLPPWEKGVRAARCLAGSVQQHPPAVGGSNRLAGAAPGEAGHHRVPSIHPRRGGPLHGASGPGPPFTLAPCGCASHRLVWQGHAPAPKGLHSLRWLIHTGPIGRAPPPPTPFTHTCCRQRILQGASREGGPHLRCLALCLLCQQRVVGGAELKQAGGRLLRGRAWGWGCVGGMAQSSMRWGRGAAAGEVGERGCCRRGGARGKASVGIEGRGCEEKPSAETASKRTPATSILWRWGTGRQWANRHGCSHTLAAPCPSCAPL